MTSGTILKGMLVKRLNLLGSQGWEVIGIAGSDKTIGLNSLEVILRRRRALAPPGLPDGWHPDPVNPGFMRWVSEGAWTHDVRAPSQAAEPAPGYVADEYCPGCGGLGTYDGYRCSWCDYAPGNGEEAPSPAGSPEPADRTAEAPPASACPTCGAAVSPDAGRCPHCDALMA